MFNNVNEVIVRGENDKKMNKIKKCFITERVISHFRGVEEILDKHEDGEGGEQGSYRRGK